MKVLVTGAGGYIGRHVVKALKDLNIEVLAVDLNLKNLRGDVEKKEINIFEMNSDTLIDQLGKVDGCVHLAWRDGFVHNSENHMKDLSNHYEFITNLIDNGVKNISILGSMHEIGYHHGAVDETTPTNPISMYGISKNALRKSLKIVADSKDMKLKWLRAFYMFGDDRNNNSLFSKILKMEEEGKKTFPFTSGKNGYDYISIEDLAMQIAKATIQVDITNEINVCSGKAIPLKDAVDNFLKENNLKIKPEYGTFPDRKYDSPAIWGDNTKILNILKNSEEN